MLTLLLTPSGATFSMLLRFRLFGASAIGEDFWRWRPLLKGSLSRCGDSVSLPMDRDRPMPPFIFPQNQTPYPTPLPASLPLDPNPKRHEIYHHISSLLHPSLQHSNKEIHKRLHLTALSTTWQQQAAEFQTVKTGPNSRN